MRGITLMWTRAPRLAVAMAVAAMAAPVLFARAEQQAPPQAQKPPGFRSSVDLVRGDVSVVDNKGMTVRGPGGDGFRAFRAGRQRRVGTAAVGTYDPPPTGGP